MDYYTLLKFLHIIGLVVLGGGLLAVFVSELRAYGTNDIGIFSEAARYTAVFYDALVAPGPRYIWGAPGLRTSFRLLRRSLARRHVGALCLRVRRREYRHAGSVPPRTQGIAEGTLVGLR